MKEREVAIRSVSNFVGTAEGPMSQSHWEGGLLVSLHCTLPGCPGPSLGSEPRWWAPDFGWCMMTVVCVYPETRCKPSHHPYPSPRKQAVVLLDHLCINTANLRPWRKEEALCREGMQAGSWALPPGSNPRTLRNACSHPQRTLVPRGSLCSTQRSLSSFSGLRGI